MLYSNEFKKIQGDSVASAYATAAGSPDAAAFWAGKAKEKQKYPLPVNGGAIDCVLAYIMGDKAVRGTNLAQAALVKQGEASSTAEISHTKNGAVSTVVVNCAENGNLRACVKQGANISGAVLSSVGKKNGLPVAEHAIFLSAISTAEHMEAGVKQRMEDLVDAYGASGNILGHENVVVEVANMINDLFENNLIGYNAQYGSLAILSDQIIKSGTLGGDVVFGKPQYVNGGSSATGGSGAARTFKEAMNMKMFADWRAKHPRTEGEKMLIPEFPDDMPVREETIIYARKYVVSQGMRTPMNNFLLRGETAAGKSVSAEQAAALLGMPFLRFVCGSGTDQSDLMSRFVPVSDSAAFSDLPDLDEIYYCPDEAYKQITGEEKPDATPDDAFKAYTNAVKAEAGEKSGAPQFKLVESNLVRAMRKGWICEVQEMSRVKDPGIFVSLNEYDHPGALIPLADGTYARRHQEALIIYTDNVGYISCRPVDPSVIRRMSLVIDFQPMSEGDVLRRVAYNVPDFKDKAMLKKIYDVWSALRKHIAENDISGACSVTELERWAQAIVLDEMSNIYRNCKQCVISKISSDPEEQAEMENSVLAQAFSTGD